jgi:hypothetical protein
MRKQQGSTMQQFVHPAEEAMKTCKLKIARAISLAAFGVLVPSSFGQARPTEVGSFNGPTSTMPLPGLPGGDALDPNADIKVSGREISFPLLGRETQPTLAAVTWEGISHGIQFTPVQLEFRLPIEEWRKSTPPDFATSFIPDDWSDYNFLVIEWKASSSERFQLELFTPDGMVAKRIQPFQNAWVRASIPLDYFRKPAREGFDLAATYNKHRDSYWININFGGWAPCKNVSAIGFQMDGPIPVDGKPPQLEIRSIKLSKEDPGDVVLEPKVLVDKFGQWIPAEWPGKAHSLDDLKKAWAVEEAGLKSGGFGYDKYGGYADTSAKATGFFRLEQIDGKWWFVDPDGHLFYSNGVNGIGFTAATPVANRREIFEEMPPDIAGGTGVRGGGNSASFYTANIAQRFRDRGNFNSAWGELTFRRLDAWGFNTVAGFGNMPLLNIASGEQRKPYTIMLRNWQGGGAGGGAGAGTIMGLPDVYAPDFEQIVDQAAAAQCDGLRSDPYLLGYFVGNEPPWPGRESVLCDAIRAGPDTGLKARLQDFLRQGDTPARRKQFVYETFDQYLATIIAAIRKHDPNHLILGIRLGGEVPDEVYRAARVFDVCSINVYEFAIDPKLLDKIAGLTGRPLLVGEFHFGAPERGLGGGLRQVASQKDRGLAYSYYVEHAAAHPNIIGTHWFQWIDQPSTGRNDGENYNIGLVDVTDQPYTELIAGMIRTHKRLLDVHSGKVAPTTEMPQGRSTAEIRLEHATMVPPPGVGG